MVKSHKENNSFFMEKFRKKLNKFFRYKNKKWKVKKYFFLKAIIVLFMYIWIAYWALYFDISPQTSTSDWSNNSRIKFSYWTGGITRYVTWDNSTVLWNHFEGFYYNSVFWFFELDWSGDKNDNVRIVSSTDKCWTWYGYKIGWYAYSEYSGLIDFDYNNDVFVYYCENDQWLHWYAYLEHIWFQSFEWIKFAVIPAIAVNPNNTWTWLFVNDVSDINQLKWKYIDNLEDTNESIFYIIK